MAGVSFAEDSDAVDPATPLAPLLTDWAEYLRATASQATVDSYLRDAAVVAAALCDVLGRSTDAVDAMSLTELREYPHYPQRWSTRSGPKHVEPARVAFARAHLTLAPLTLADLHPRNLSRAFDVVAGSRATSSAARAHTAWSVFCAFLVRRELLAADPTQHWSVTRAKFKPGAPKPLTEDEARKLLTVTTLEDPAATAAWLERDMAVATTFLACGVRIGEARTLTIDTLRRQGTSYDPDVPGSSEGLRLEVTGKGGKTRTVPVYAEAEVILDQYLISRRERVGPYKGTDPLFVRANGSAFTDRALRRLVENWFLRAGVRRPEGACVHALRHTFATLALDSGSTVVEVQRLLGHASLQTTQKYLAVVGSGLEDAVRAHTTRSLVREMAAGRQPAVAGPRAS